jgi:membrane-associated phospholipid phosphatase
MDTRPDPIPKRMHTLTDFGDTAVVLPLSVVISWWLLRHHSRRVLVAWIIALSLCITITALSKTYLYACPIGTDLVSPSGHTSLSTPSYGAIALAIAVEESRILQTSVLGAGIGFIFAIAGSRVVLNTHSVLEVGIGILIGITTLGLFTSYYLRWRNEGAPLLMLVLPAIVVIAVFHGQELRIELVLHAISHHSYRKLRLHPMSVQMALHRRAVGPTLRKTSVD